MAKEIQAQDVIILIVYLVILLLGAYYLTKYVSKRAMQKGVKKPLGKGSGSAGKWKQGQYVSVVDRIAVDRDKTLMVVEFNNKRYLMSTTAQEIKLLDKTEIDAVAGEAEADLSPETAAVSDEGEFSGENFADRFKSSFKQVFKNYFKKNSGASFGFHLKKEMESGEMATKQDDSKQD